MAHGRAAAAFPRMGTALPTGRPAVVDERQRAARYVREIVEERQRAIRRHEERRQRAERRQQAAARQLLERQRQEEERQLLAARAMLPPDDPAAVVELHYRRVLCARAFSVLLVFLNVSVCREVYRAAEDSDGGFSGLALFLGPLFLLASHVPVVLVAVQDSGAKTFRFSPESHQAEAASLKSRLWWQYHIFLSLAAHFLMTLAWVRGNGTLREALVGFNQRVRFLCQLSWSLAFVDP